MHHDLAHRLGVDRDGTYPRATAPWCSGALHRGLGAATDLVTAASVLGIGRTTAHTLARAGRFPVPVLRVGHRYRVPVAPILRLLALDPAQPDQPIPNRPVTGAGPPPGPALPGGLPDSATSGLTGPAESSVDPPAAYHQPEDGNRAMPGSPSSQE